MGVCARARRSLAWPFQSALRLSLLSQAQAGRRHGPAGHSASPSPCHWLDKITPLIREHDRRKPQLAALRLPGPEGCDCEVFAEAGSLATRTNFEKYTSLARKNFRACSVTKK